MIPVVVWSLICAVNVKTHENPVDFPQPLKIVDVSGGKV